MFFFSYAIMRTIDANMFAPQIIAPYSCLCLVKTTLCRTMHSLEKSWSILDKTVFFKNELKERLADWPFRTVP